MLAGLAEYTPGNLWSSAKLHKTLGAMRALNSLVGARGLVLLSAWSPLGVLAGPTVNVALRASFHSAPYLVELLYVSMNCSCVLSTDRYQGDRCRRERNRIFPPPRPDSRWPFRHRKDGRRAFHIFCAASSVGWTHHRPRNAFVVSIRPLGAFGSPEDRSTLPILQYVGGAFIEGGAGVKLRYMGGFWREAVLLPRTGRGSRECEE